VHGVTILGSLFTIGPAGRLHDICTTADASAAAESGRAGDDD